jgi:hypothetical protein
MASSLLNILEIRVYYERAKNKQWNWERK